MFMHNKRLQYTGRVSEPNPVVASFLLEQFGGPDGEPFALTGDWHKALAIGIIEPFFQTFAFMAHDRFWSKRANRGSVAADPTPA